MKISDFFSNLPWRTDGNVSFLYLTPEQNRAIAIAVNNHDRLTEENKRLRELLKGVVIEFDSQHLDADSYGLMCGIKKELGVIDENNPPSQG
ncbi:hypothetical protein ACS0KS_002605 [Vibrio cholerae]